MMQPFVAPLRTTSSAVLGSLALAAVLVVAGAPTHAQESPSPAAYERVSGTWELAISDDDARARLERGIQGAVDGMLPLVSSIAAGQLRDRVRIPHRLEIRATPAEISVRMDDARPYTTRPGVTVDSTAPGGGEPMRVTQLFRGENLEQSFQTPNGSKWNTYVIDGEQLRFDAVVASPQLPGQVRFSLPFRRVR